MKVTALIPMKDHSERVPNKNMRFFAGKPLYHRVVETLEMSEFVDSIIINTDSEIIAKDATNNFSKVRIHERPAELCGDMVATNDIFKYDICLLEDEYFLQTHSTNPLLTIETLNRAVATFETSLSDYDSLFSVTKIQARLYWESGKAVNHDSAILLRTQDLPPLYEENSTIYLFSRESFRNSGDNRIGLKPKMFIMDKFEAIDIDDEEDFRLAETLYRLKAGEKNDAES